MFALSSVYIHFYFKTTIQQLLGGLRQNSEAPKILWFLEACLLQVKLLSFHFHVLPIRINLFSLNSSQHFLTSSQFQVISYVQCGLLPTAHCPSPDSVTQFGSIPGMSHSETAITRGKTQIMLLPPTTFWCTTCLC